MIYKNPDYTIEERVEDLLARMNFDEKCAQLMATMPHTIGNSFSLSEDKIKEVLKNGIGRITQFAFCSILDIVNVGKIHNQIQKFLIEETRLGIPFIAQVETLNGLVAVDATSFPTPLALASSFNTELANKMAKIISKETRAVGCHYALSPVVDLAKDPRWGRCYETFGEDKYLSSQMGISIVKGLQGDGLDKNVAACAKHFLGYSASQGGLNTSESHIGHRELYEEYATPFEAMIKEANLQGIMCSYSAVDGEVISFSKNILTDLLRDRMGFTGTAVCDGGSIERGHTHQGLYSDKKNAAAASVKAGLCADGPVADAFCYLKEAVDEGLLSEEDIDKQVRYVLRQKFQLGLFDNPYVDVEKIKEIFSDNIGKNLSKEIADESIILLKNENNFLPISNDDSIAVIGPHGNRLASQFASYSFIAAVDMFLALKMGEDASMLGVAENMAAKKDDAFEEAYKLEDADKGGSGGLFLKALIFMAKHNVDMVDMMAKWKIGTNTLYKSLKTHLGNNVKYEKGCDIAEGDEFGIAKAVKLAKESKVVVLALGDKCGFSNDSISGEGKDNASLELPEIQQKLLEEVYKVNKNIVLVMSNGRPMTINFAAEKVPAILEAWYNGPYAGESLADILLGKVNPSGKLPITIPRHSGQIPVCYNHKSGSGYNKIQSVGLEKLFGSSYTDMSAAPLYEFGHGLSYTDFELSDFKVDKEIIGAGERFSASVTITNTGKLAGAETVMLFVKLRNLDVTTNYRQLIGFQKVKLNAGEKVLVNFDIDTTLFATFNMENEFCVRKCQAVIEIGTGSNKIFSEKHLKIEGKLTVDKNNRSFTTETKYIKI